MSIICLIICVKISVVANVKGKKFDIKAETVDEVIKQVEVLANLESGQSNLLFRGKPLNSSESLIDKGINNGDVVNIVKKPIKEDKIDTSFFETYKIDKRVLRFVRAYEILMDKSFLDEFTEINIDNFRNYLLKNQYLVEESEKESPEFQKIVKFVKDDNQIHEIVRSFREEYAKYKNEEFEKER